MRIIEEMKLKFISKREKNGKILAKEW